jgi:uncharacterized protein (TIGR02271 family)
MTSHDKSPAGLFKSKASFVPIHGASADGDRLVVAYDKRKVKDAPQVDDDGDGYLTPAEEHELYRYFEREYTSVESAQSTGGEPVGHDTSGPTTDNAMTRSEEQLVVGTARQDSGRVRLRKYGVTDNVTTTVAVAHEEVRVEREPITDANIGSAMDGPAISEEEHEVVLHEERPVVEKEVVAKERVRLDKQTVNGEAEVNEKVRKERIEGPDEARDQPRQ